jgi:tetratricopeptide (TPR) repeat protein
MAFLLLASMLARAPAVGGTIDKARILADLSASPAYTAARVKSNPKDTSELALDLIVYRWTSRASKMPTDVRNADQIISGIAKELADPLTNWSIDTFSTQSAATPRVAVPPTDDPRVAQLSELRRQLGMALDYRDSSPIQSVNALTTVLGTCQTLHLDISEALVRTMLGHQYHYDMARYRLAEECYGRAVLIFSAYDCSEAAALLYDDYGALGAEMARSLVAIENYSLAARQWAQLAKQYPTVSRYRVMAGREFIRAGQAQSAAGDPDKALQLVNNGLDALRAAATMTKSYDELIRNLIKVSDLYRDQNDLPKALELLGAAARACQYSDDPLLIALVHANLAAAYRAMNLVPKANEELAKRDKILLDAARDGEAALGKLASPTALPKESQTKLQLTAEKGAGALQELNKNAESAAMLQRVLDVYKRSALVDEQIRSLRSMAAVLDLQHKSQESLAARMEAAMLAMKTNRKVLAAEIVREMVQTFIEIGDLDNALDTLADLGPIMEQSGNVRGAADVLEGRGTLLASHGRFEAAVQDFQQALTRYKDQVGDPWAAEGVTLKLASALQSLNKPADASTVLESGLNEIETRYADENADPSGSPERARLMMGLYEELASAYVRNGKSDSAKTLVTKARRYQWVGELVTRLKSSSNADVANFAKTIDIVGGDPDPNSVPQVPNKQTLLADNWADFSAKCAMLREQHPAQYNALPINPLEFYKSRNDLPRKSLVIEYLPTDYSTFAFVCGNGKSSLWELGISSKNINTLATSLRNSIKNCEQSLSAGVPLPRISDWREPTFLEIRDPLVSLYARLVAPISADFAEYQILMFALPSELEGVPMHALITSEQGSVPRFMIQDYEIGYLGEGMLGDLIKKDSRPIDSSSDRLAIFADPAGDLPGARKEATMLEGLYFTSSVYVGRRATVGNFIKECDKASILHIAVHYKIDPNPSKFVLQLASDGETNGQITVQELSAITNPHLQLVVLSACDSAASADPLQFGPSRAAEVFSLAGAKSVLGGIWKVSDTSASKLMGDFYRTICRGKTRTGSLQSAQVKMIEEKTYAHPFYWACFALYGNPW